MKKECFINNISDETIVNLIDGVIKLEKNHKTNNIKSNLLRIIPIAAAVVLVIGLVNILPMFNNADIDVNTAVPGVNSPAINSPETTDNLIPIELFLPVIIEKSCFEEQILAYLDTGSFEKFMAYYTLKDLADPNITDTAKEEILAEYPICKYYAVYVLDPYASEKEKNVILDYLRDLINSNGDILAQIYKNNNMINDKQNTFDPYNHVRFGDDCNTLLLDIEWHTPETYLKEVVEDYKNYIKETDEYNPDEDTYLKMFEDNLQKIKDKKIYISRIINGKRHGGLNISNLNDDCFDENGYYILEIYPYHPNVSYYDEDDVFQFKTFDWAYSLNQYTYILENDIIPYCDDLLEQGLISQEKYDECTMENPLDYYINLYF